MQQTNSINDLDTKNEMASNKINIYTQESIDSPGHSRNLMKKMKKKLMITGYYTGCLHRGKRSVVSYIQLHQYLSVACQFFLTRI